LHERLAAAFDRAGLAERACAHRISLAEITSDAALSGAAVRCERAAAHDGGAERLLAALDEDVRSVALEAAARTPEPERTTGNLVLDATWSAPADVDLTVITPNGSRLSWMGGPGQVTGADATSRGRERLALRFLPAGTYLVEVSRTEPGDAPITGEVAVRALSQDRRLPFTLTGERATIGRVVVTREQRVVPFAQ
jgi:hypothetical protein